MKSRGVALVVVAILVLSVVGPWVWYREESAAPTWRWSEAGSAPVWQHFSAAEIAALEAKLPTLRDGDSLGVVFSKLGVNGTRLQPGCGGGPLERYRLIYCLGTHNLVLFVDEVHGRLVISATPPSRPTPPCLVKLPALTMR